VKRQHPGIPVIVMSAVSDIQLAREAVNQGAHEYLIKPFDQELLKTKCLRIF
jgi:two-component system nitrogen regulation response regulator GlnG